MSDTPRTDVVADELRFEYSDAVAYDTALRHARQLEHELAEKDAALVLCVEALRTLENSDCRAIGKTEKCAHGKYGYEDCETCFADFACTILTSLPQSAKQETI